MTVRYLAKEEWTPFFNYISKTLSGSQAEIDVGSLALGGHVQADWIPFIGLVYDPKDDLVEVALEGLDHLIRSPREIQVEEGNGQLVSIEIIDAQEDHQIIKLKEPLLLPAPQK